MSLIETFGLLFTSDADQVEKDAKKAEKAVDDTERKISQAGDATEELTKKFDRASESAKSISESSGKSSADVALIGKEADRSQSKISGVGREFGNLSTDADRSASSLTGRFRTILGFAGGLTAIGVAASAAFKVVAEQASNIEGVSRFSERLGLDTAQVIAWGEAVKRSGGDAKGLVSTIQTLSNGIQGITVGNSKLVEQLGVLGSFSGTVLSIFKDDGTLKTATELLPEIAGALENLDRPQATFLAGQLGIDAGTINLLLEGKDATLALVAAQKEYADGQAKVEEDAKRTSNSLAGLEQTQKSLVASFTENAANVAEGLDVAFDSDKKLGELQGGIFDFQNNFLVRGIDALFNDAEAQAIQAAPGGQAISTRTSQVSIGDVNVDARGGDSREISTNVVDELRRQTEDLVNNYDDGVAR